MYTFAGSFLGAWYPRNTLLLSRCNRIRCESRATTCRAVPSQAAVASLQAWISERSGVINDALDFSKPGTVCIAQDRPRVLKGTELLVLPIGVLITPQLARSAVQKLIASGTDISQFNDECMLAVYLLRERSLGIESEFAPFVAACPAVAQCYQVFLWTDEELQLLEGSPIKEKAGNLRTGIEEEWKELDQIVFASNREAFPESAFSLQDYLWAQAVVLSHCVSGGSEMPIVMAPIVSSMRLPTLGETFSCLMQYRGGGFFGKPRLTVLSNKEVKAGEALTVASGSEMFNDSMLLEYGIASEHNLASRIDVEFSISALDKFFEEKECILEQEGFGATHTFSLKAPTAKGKWDVPEFMEAFVRLMCLGGSDVFLLETIFEKEVWGHMAFPVSMENEKAMCECIIGACEDALEGYPVQDDTVWGDDADGGLFKKQLASFAVAGEKAILEACKGHYVRHLTTIDSLQYYHERRLDSLDLLRPLDESEIADIESSVRMGRAFDQNY